jgi:hypothetical protein
MARLLTETADYDTPGSWGPASDGWPEIRGDVAYDMYVFASCIESIPYGSYVLMSRRGHYGDTKSMLRVHFEYKEKLERDFERAGRPNSDDSVARREKYGKKDYWGNREKAPLYKKKSTALAKS